MELDEKRTDNLAFILGVLSFFLMIFSYLYFVFLFAFVLSCFALYFGIMCKNKLYRCLTISTFLLGVIALINTLYILWFTH